MTSRSHENSRFIGNSFLMHKHLLRELLSFKIRESFTHACHGMFSCRPVDSSTFDIKCHKSKASLVIHETHRVVTRNSTHSNKLYLKSSSRWQSELNFPGLLSLNFRDHISQWFSQTLIVNGNLLSMMVYLYVHVCS